MSTKQSIFTKLDDPPGIHDISQVFYSKKKDCILISQIANRDKSSGIYEYDLQSQNITKKYDYPSLLSVGAAYQCCIDDEQNTIYLTQDYITNTTRNNIHSLNLNTLKWNTNLCKQPIENKPAMICLSSPLNHIYLISSEGHEKYDTKNKDATLVKIEAHKDSETVRDAKQAKLIYAQSTKQLYMFQQRVNHILECKIDKPFIKWTKFGLKLPRFVADLGTWDVKLVFDQIIFWFDFDYKSKTNYGRIYCLDLLHPKKWYLCAQKAPFDHLIGYNSPLFVIMDKRNDVHLLQFTDDFCFDLNHDTSHYKVSAFDLIPPEVDVINRKRCNPLVIGFVKQFERTHDMIYIPLYLKELILTYYPIFC